MGELHSYLSLVHELFLPSSSSFSPFIKNHFPGGIDSIASSTPPPASPLPLRDDVPSMEMRQHDIFMQLPKLENLLHVLKGNMKGSRREDGNDGGCGPEDPNSSRIGSVVSDCGRRPSSCGYCRSPTPSSISHGLRTQSLTVDDYLDLLDRGWRRAGCFLYKPEMRKTCCPSYTVRLKAADFAPSKEQTRVIRRMERYLNGDLEPKGPEELVEGVQSTDVSCSCNCYEIECPANQEFSSGKDGDLSTSERFMQYLSNEIDLTVNRFNCNPADRG
ncbi:hypothetical protein MLD38_011119 [Melastoma candidum]|uniref:Uncharacterized protein n=1 Tax=Melastoma candidum TaxID=119954 RepID=A0ACB9R220_9MYRT|nr:hypothetical protein MLD38_011119 [Melastoma candidum]